MLRGPCRSYFPAGADLPQGFRNLHTVTMPKWSDPLEIAKDTGGFCYFSFVSYRHNSDILLLSDSLKIPSLNYYAVWVY